ncbi:MAG: DNA repair protein RecO [Candidatus Staskawiczbacteria bacterium RIFOXYB2_FULL_32_9]|uniref:DNA repair protein RecO n=1 Tax=Candidatus Staskawiczbacteria bacterium RIFOXYD1_FULL_32_13 TaxID=1802234 RepID=A0A1G2JQN1_9BACT|nr:MAG: DNA repair protein RecO [Candidatus Staskawiczbacteria bacterium RIFOXYA2_FULL_32_7]OGZ80754.1 MAG: DNA repair protein RecO [Candidatus Staskawiczbacteria bacterium RIFOXYB1_FULL_32_11]OGZ82290.1 MAG: DNA repair protein RecO [Candidatus Staskawiczbacteria bacterium RIFOXYB2_FULL_32_9]OGZ86873.1 MAG: DNA repair protein RecO [Candidatus Staskawiczbacteria bacterium RIFOXYC2_FULL_32_10]OGZ89457.1 MAG: DNA repair protein RecO [Candidatus Staskawiczbacteria bacterium RIFOXYD1_FULL_32_13]
MTKAPTAYQFIYIKDNFMALQYKTKGFIYKKRDRGEADRIFTVFTYDFGKINVWAKSIRKINSKLKSGIDIFYLSDIEFVQGKKRTLTDAVLINKFTEITKTPEKFIIAKKVAKLLDDFVKGEQHDHEIFNLINETFEKLNQLSCRRHCDGIAIPEAIQSKGTNSRLPRSPNELAHNDGKIRSQLLYLSFAWNFFAILGYKPQIINCAHCHSKLNEKELYFSNKDGGVICKNCYVPNTLDSRFSPHFAGEAGRGNDIVINSDIIKILRIIFKNDWEILLKLKINLETQKQLNQISKNYYLYLLSNHKFSK